MYYIIILRNTRVQHSVHVQNGGYTINCILLYIILYFYNIYIYICEYMCVFSSKTSIRLQRSVYGYFSHRRKYYFIVSCVQTLDRVSNLFLIVVTTVRVSILASLSKCRRVVMSEIGQYVPIYLIVVVKRIELCH